MRLARRNNKMLAFDDHIGQVLSFAIGLCKERSVLVKTSNRLEYSEPHAWIDSPLHMRAIAEWLTARADEIDEIEGKQ
jgi:hypothetical protein